MMFTKEQVAVRQLDTAIRMLFNGGDVVSIQTLAGAAAVVFKGLAEKRIGNSWTEKIANAYPGGKKDWLEMLRAAQNFFKHANNDPEGQFEFEENRNYDMIFLALLEYSTLLKHKQENRKFSIPMSFYEIWYFAINPEALADEESAEIDQLKKAIAKMFPDFQSLPKFEQLARGSIQLRDYEKTLNE